MQMRRSPNCTPRDDKYDKYSTSGSGGPIRIEKKTDGIFPDVTYGASFFLIALIIKRPKGTVRNTKWGSRAKGFK